MDLSLITLGVLIVIVILALRAIIHIVPEYQRLIVFRLGSFEKVAGPGIVLLLPPPIQSVAQTVDLREFVVEIPQQTCITKDNAPISIDFLIYQKVMEEQAADSILKIKNFHTAVTAIATTPLRAVIGDILLDDVLAKREQINEVLRTKLDEVTQRWGVKVTTVEIRELTPPRDVQEAMNRQLTAERTRRASVTEAEGKRASAILVAEGDKQSNILQAEGQRQSQILRAEGFALALDKINEMASHADNRTITLQYMDALRQPGGGCRRGAARGRRLWRGDRGNGHRCAPLCAVSNRRSHIRTAVRSVKTVGYSARKPLKNAVGADLLPQRARYVREKPEPD